MRESEYVRKDYWADADPTTSSLGQDHPHSDRRSTRN
jgi:hypothetical protein